ncbi:MAG TPA: hypothetical protein PKD12_14290 [Nitrospira sp.]|nr:hypothetical protein [Nitrospira sp.]
MGRHIVCVQIPSFQIALARSIDRALRNRPVAIAPTHTPRALIRELSIEALHEGLHPGIPLDIGRLICPGLRVIPPDASLLHTAHRELQQRIAGIAPAWESIRPGSLFLDLTGTTRLFGPPLDIATRISRELIDQQGWPSLIGLAGNKLVSQLAATTLAKPPPSFINSSWSRIIIPRAITNPHSSRPSSVPDLSTLTTIGGLEPAHTRRHRVRLTRASACGLGRSSHAAARVGFRN